MRSVRLFVALLKIGLITQRRYAFNTITQLLTMYLSLALAVAGASFVGRGTTTIGHTVSALALGMVVSFACLTSFAGSAQALAQGAALGTLEQQAMSSVGLRRFVLIQAVAGLATQLGYATALLLLASGTVGQRLHVNLLAFLPLVTITMVSVIGLGLIVGGLTMLFKETGAILQVLQFGVFALVFAPAQTVAGLRFLPVSWGASLLSRTIVDGAPVARVGFADLAFLVANSAAYLALGLVVFGALDRQARRRGLLAHY